jgi:hypothetical protein
MSATELFARRATLSRSVRLLSEFHFEQTDPARFYTALAEDTAAMVTDLWRATHREPAAGRTLLDVGGGPGYFAMAFKDAGLQYIGVEPDPSEMHAGPSTGGTATYVRASGMALPFADASVDICLSSNVPSMCRSHGGWLGRCCGSPGPAAWPCCPTRCGWARSAGTRRD